MFTKKPTYTATDLNDAVTRIERLQRLEDAIEQHLRLNHQKMTQETYTAYKQRQEQYARNIVTAQLYLDKLTAIMGGKG